MRFIAALRAVEALGGLDTRFAFFLGLRGL